MRKQNDHRQLLPGDHRRVALTAPALDQDLNVDVAIIGGGITGVSAALHLAERGYEVALLEAQDIGWGASGRNGGQVLAGFGVGQVKLKKLVGAEPAQRLWDMSVEAVNLQRAQIQRFDIPCDPAQGYLHAALKGPPGARAGGNPGGIRAAWRAGGSDFARATNCTRDWPVRAMWPRSRIISPGISIRSTTRSASPPRRGGAGAKLFAQTRVTEVTPGRRIKIRAGGHEIRASFLLTAGGAYLGELMQPLTGYIMPVSTYIIATRIPRRCAPVDPRQRGGGRPEFRARLFPPFAR